MNERDTSPSLHNLEQAVIDCAVDIVQDKPGADRLSKWPPFEAAVRALIEARRPTDIREN
jgi:hypothetical protein